MHDYLIIVELELADGITSEAMESFWAEDFHYVPWDGWTPRLMKGVKGARENQYAIAMDVEGYAYNKSAEQKEQERVELYQNNPDNEGLMARLREMGGFGSVPSTQYEVITHSALVDASSPLQLYRYSKLTLQDGVTPEQFETFCKDVWAKTAWVAGETCYVLKGVGGERDGEYAFVVEVHGDEAQARVLGSPEAYSEAWVQVFAENSQNQPSLDELKTLATGFGIESYFTNYLEVGPRAGQ